MDNNKILTVAIYVRVSTEEQMKHGYSIQAQKESLIKYCKEKKYKVYDIYADEGKSARSKLKQRTEMCRLLEDVKDKKINRIVFIKLDRWFRNIADYYKVQEILDKYHVDWETTQEDYNTTTSSGRLNLNIRLSIAQDEADRTADRIRFTFDNMIKNKRAIQGSHCMPLGYIVEGVGKEKHVVKDKEKEHIVKDMFEHFANYNSIRGTLLYLNNKYQLHLCYDSVRHYFKNELYTGKYKNIIDYCEPYITYDEFLENQKRINCNVKVNAERYDYIFSGLMRCNKCGYKLSGFTHKSKTYKNHAYRCNRAYNSKSCTNISPIIESNLEKYLINNFLLLYNKHVSEETIIEKENTKKRISNEQINKKLDRLTDLYVDGRITREKYNTEYDKYKSMLVEEKEKPIKKKIKSLVNAKALDIYNQLDNKSKHAFWLTYIDYIERDEHKNYIVHFK